MRVLLGLAGLIASASAVAEPLLFDNGRLFVAARINGTPSEALLDSGAEASIVDPQLAARAGLPEGEPITLRGTGGTAPAHIIQGAVIEALGLRIAPEAVVAMDLDELSQRLIKRPTEAIVGRELFDAARIRVDIRGNSVAAMSRDNEPPGQRLPLTAHAGIESVPVVVNGHPAQAEFDLGNGSGVLVSRPMAKRLGLKVTGRAAGGAIGGALMRDTGVIDRLEVAGVTFRQVPAAIDDQPNANDLNIGTSILKDFLITADFSQRAVWLQPNGERR